MCRFIGDKLLSLTATVLLETLMGTTRDSYLKQYKIRSFIWTTNWDALWESRNEEIPLCYSALMKSAMLH